MMKIAMTLPIKPIKAPSTRKACVAAFETSSRRRAPIWRGLFRKETPTLFHRCLAVHMQGAALKGALN